MVEVRLINETQDKRIKSMKNLVLGIDPGIKGALALVDADAKDQNRLVEVWQMPVVKKMVGKGNEVSAVLLAGIFKEVLAYRDGWDNANLSVVLEVVRAMPKNGAVSMFSFGRSFGVIEGVVAGFGLSVRMVRPQEWKKKWGLLKKDKDASRGLVLQMFPEMADEFKLKKDCDKADAVLLALVGSE